MPTEESEGTLAYIFPGVSLVRLKVVGSCYLSNIKFDRSRIICLDTEHYDILGGGYMGYIADLCLCVCVCVFSPF